MARTNASFKFGKMNKIKLGNIIDPVARSIFKKCMIDAVQSYTVNKHRKPREDKATPDNRQTPT